MLGYTLIFLFDYIIHSVSWNCSQFPHEDMKYASFYFQIFLSFIA